MQRTSTTRALSWATLAILLALMWFLLTGKVDSQEALLGLISLVLTGLAMIKSGAGNFAPFYPRARWLGHLLTLPYQVLRDSSTVILALLRTLAQRRPPADSFSSAHFNAGGEDALSVTKRGLATGLTSFPPNSIVVEISREEDTILYHELVPQGTTPEPAKTLGEE
jgi:multisubunit Na+/H+ antiporter MnhE subunit